MNLIFYIKTKTNRFSFFLLFLLFSSVTLTVLAQQQPVTIIGHNLTVKEVLEQIENKTKLSIDYDSQILNLQKRVKRIESSNIGGILKELFSNKYLIHYQGNHVIITEKRSFSVRGKVLDANNQSIIGANVIVLNSTNGTITDAEGNFYLKCSPSSTLEISYLGYKKKQISLQGKRQIQIVMYEENAILNEVVVVGYGIQKKVDLTGSVASVSAKEIADRPSVNTTNLLQGKVNGLSLVSNSAQPGRDGSSISLRGSGSFSTNSSPLILIDGVIGSISELSSNDIESVSVLKDAASAAIYGARAANGVVLVTTKKGKKGKSKVTYSFNYGIQEATRLSNQIWDSSTYMEMYNQLADRMGGKTKYSQETIDKYKDPNRDKNLYPDYNWMEETFHTGSVIRHNLGISGGTNKMTYNISLDYTKQKGLLDNHDYKKYTGLVSVDVKVSKRIKIGTTINFYNGKVNEPYYTNQSLLLMIAQSRPMTKPYLLDGSGRYSYLPFPLNKGGEYLNRNPVWAMNETERVEESWRSNAQIYANVEFLKKKNIHLSWNSKAAFRYTDKFKREHYPAKPKGYYYLPESAYKTGGRNEHLYATDFFPEKRVTNRDDRSFYLMFSSLLNLNWNITSSQQLNAMIGYQEESYKSRYLYGYRENYPSDSMKELDGGSTEGQRLGGNVGEFAIRSLFGRLNYSYKGKYLFEANFRYDGTSRIHKDHRWGIFPSFSGAWRISEESFIKDNLSWLDNLKLRASYGVLGNSSIGNYPYQEVYQTSNYIFNEKIAQGVYQSAMKDKTLRWEKTQVTDLGLETSIYSGLLSFSVGYYNKVTDDILSRASIPSSVGLGAPTVNYGKLRNRGFEFEIRHQNKIGDFIYGAGFMASFNRNKVLKLKSPIYNSYIYEEGKPYGEHYLYIYDGIFQSEEDIRNSPKHPNNPKPGDIKFKDLNGDNKIDSKDRKMVEGVHPKMTYSFNLNFGYKNFDLSAFFQGVAGRKIYTDGFGEVPFAQGMPPNKKWLNAWTPENKNTDVPALYTWGYAPMSLRSTFNLKDASYLRCKNLQIGYNFSRTFLRNIGLEFLRIYLSAENLFMITDYPSYDPERFGDGWHAVYPQAKTYSLGLNLKF